MAAIHVLYLHDEKSRGVTSAVTHRRSAQYCVIQVEVARWQLPDQLAHCCRAAFSQGTAYENIQGVRTGTTFDCWDGEMTFWSETTAAHRRKCRRCAYRLIEMGSATSPTGICKSSLPISCCEHASTLIGASRVAAAVARGAIRSGSSSLQPFHAQGENCVTQQS